jgi:hypothetical protein
MSGCTNARASATTWSHRTNVSAKRRRAQLRRRHASWRAIVIVPRCVSAAPEVMGNHGPSIDIDVPIHPGKQPPLRCRHDVRNAPSTSYECRNVCATRTPRTRRHPVPHSAFVRVPHSVTHPRPTMTRSRRSHRRPRWCPLMDPPRPKRARRVHCDAPPNDHAPTPRRVPSRAGRRMFSRRVGAARVCADAGPQGPTRSRRRCCGTRSRTLGTRAPMPVRWPPWCVTHVVDQMACGIGIMCVHEQSVYPSTRSSGYK